MKNDLTFSIGTKYNGEGFKKLDQALKTTGAKAKNASKAISGISTALGDIGGEAGKAVGAIGGVVQGFMQLGVVGGVIAVGTAAIQGLFKWLNKTNDAISELSKGFADRLKGAISRVNVEVAKTNKLFTGLISDGRTKAERENINADYGLGLMEEKKKQALVGKEGSEAARIELEWTKKIEAEREKQTKKHLQDLRKEIALTEQNLKKQQIAQDVAKANFQIANTRALNAFNNDAVSLMRKNQLADEARIAKQEWKAYDKPIADLVRTLEGLRTKELKAENDAKLAPERRKSAIMQAEQSLQDALKREAEARAKLADAEEKKATEEKKKAEEALKKATEEKKKAEYEKKRAEIERKQEQIEKAGRQTAVQRLEAHKKELKAAKELAEAEAKAAKVIQQWGQNKTQSFPEWNREQNKEQREAEKVQKREQRNIDNAKKEAATLATRVFGKDGRIRRVANSFDIGRFAEASDYLGFENVSDGQVNQLRKQRDKLRRKLFNSNGTLRRGVSDIGEDMTTFKKLDKALRNVDAVKDAQKKQLEAEAAEKKRAENEDKRTQALEDIKTELKDLKDKAGI